MEKLLQSSIDLYASSDKINGEEALNLLFRIISMSKGASSLEQINWLPLHSKLSSSSDETEQQLIIELLHHLVPLSPSKKLELYRTFLPHLAHESASQIGLFKALGLDTPSNSLLALHSSLDAFYEKLATKTVYNVPLFLGSQPATEDPSFVRTHLSNQLNRMALILHSALPLVVQGPSSSGKSALIRHFAELTGNTDFVTVHINSSSDARDLLGAYIATETPGHFKWSNGILVEAVRKGKWVLIEDIDVASHDALTIFESLLNRESMRVHATGELIEIHPAFRLIATSRKASPIPRWASLFLDPIELSVSTEIIQNTLSKVPRLHKLICQLWSQVHEFCEQKLPTATLGLHGGRKPSLSDFLKFCRRINFDDLNPPVEIPSGIHPTIKTTVLKNFYDCCCLFFRSIKISEQLLFIAGNILELDEDFVRMNVIEYSPLLEITSREISFDDHCALTYNNSQPEFEMAQASSTLRQLASVARAVQNREPMLFVGEAGAGKTSVVQALANLLGKKLLVINLSQQSDLSDLLGGFKPVDRKKLVKPVVKLFLEVFAEVYDEQNPQFLQIKEKVLKLSNSSHNSNLLSCAKFMKTVVKSALKKIDPDSSKQSEASLRFADNCTDLAHTVDSLLLKLSADTPIVFSFLEGLLVQAMTQGAWILLDEINLAGAETLEKISILLESATSSLVLTERGDSKPLERHEDFRIFACMNPATDVGKSDLPYSLRSSFTEVFVQDLVDRIDIMRIIEFISPQIDSAMVADIYLSLKNSTLETSENAKPIYSLRTLSRALKFSNRNSSYFGVYGALYHGLELAFVAVLSENCKAKSRSVILQGFKDKNREKSINNISLNINAVDADHMVMLDTWPLFKGPLTIPTKFDFLTSPKGVQANLHNVSRAICARNHPILLQGPTSAGKTSIVTYLAAATGNKAVRINNHEQTTLDEYLGVYTPVGDRGELIFQEGPLVTALKQGHWIILDELNLAPTEVLEALNRLLDDNRELFVPETGELVKPHPKFMLFATQNPAGSYGGRKQLSKAFRNRFIEISVPDLAGDDFLQILCSIGEMPESRAKKLITVLEKLTMTRSASSAFSGKNSLVTLRQLFQWAQRYRKMPECDDEELQLARIGFIILGERLRSETDRQAVKEVLEHVFLRKKSLNIEEYYESIASKYYDVVSAKFPHLVWTYGLKRLFALSFSAIQNKEPLLLVGMTGAAKTTVVQILAAVLGSDLNIYNCHQNTETADFIGSLRPVRDRSSKLAQAVAMLNASPDATLHQLLEAAADNEEATDLLLQYRDKLFQWENGPLLNAMEKGEFFLVDEISLAEDSVIERLNSVLEPSQTITVPEKGEEVLITHTAVAGFRFIATMNPGGDWGKRELSPALRNRFLEIWVPAIESEGDMQLILDKWVPDCLWSKSIIDWLMWLKSQNTGKLDLSVRDLKTLADSINECLKLQMTPASAILHSVSMVLLDGLAIKTALPLRAAAELREKALDKIVSIIADYNLFLTQEEKTFFYNSKLIVDSPTYYEKSWGCSPFMLPLGPFEVQETEFCVHAQTTKNNIYKILRAAAVNKPIILEGSPGVGKTALIVALAKLTGNRLTRINFSENTCLSDLLGQDVPSERGFAWQDGILLTAIKEGHWVLLDELNLAPQTVLEGLNSLLDHRKEIVLPELGENGIFTPKESFRVFAAQNPVQQGGGRKGLPQSFLNRFTSVYMSELEDDDYTTIISDESKKDALEFIKQINAHLQAGTIGSAGSPWEINLRDVFRWIDMQNSGSQISTILLALFKLRFRSKEDREVVQRVANDIFGDLQENFEATFDNDVVSIGQEAIIPFDKPLKPTPATILPSQMPIISAMMTAVKIGLPVLLVGPNSSGKSALIKTLASLYNAQHVSIQMSDGMDVFELLGTYEQVDITRTIRQAVSEKSIEFTEMFNKNLVDEQTLHEWIGLKRSVLQVIQGASRSNSGLSEAQWQSLLKFIPELELTKSKEGVEMGSLAWFPGPLTTSVREGRWCVLENCNHASLALMDRLNPLTERGGILKLDEFSGEEVPMHENFRLFFTANPEHGELSRAMRNRCLEIYVGDSLKVVDFSLISRLVGQNLIAESAFATSIDSTLSALSSKQQASDDVDYLTSPLLRPLSLIFDNNLSKYFQRSLIKLEDLYANIYNDVVVDDESYLANINAAAENVINAFSIAKQLLLEQTAQCSDITEAYKLLALIKYLATLNSSLSRADARLVLSAMDSAGVVDTDRLAMFSGVASKDAQFPQLMINEGYAAIASKPEYFELEKALHSSFYQRLLAIFDSQTDLSRFVTESGVSAESLLETLSSQFRDLPVSKIETTMTLIDTSSLTVPSSTIGSICLYGSKLDEPLNLSSESKSNMMKLPAIWAFDIIDGFYNKSSVIGPFPSQDIREQDFSRFVQLAALSGLNLQSYEKLSAPLDVSLDLSNVKYNAEIEFELRESKPLRCEQVDVRLDFTGFSSNKDSLLLAADSHIAQKLARMSHSLVNDSIPLYTSDNALADITAASKKLKIPSFEHYSGWSALAETLCMQTFACSLVELPNKLPMNSAYGTFEWLIESLRKISHARINMSRPPSPDDPYWVQKSKLIVEEFNKNLYQDQLSILSEAHVHLFGTHVNDELRIALKNLLNESESRMDELRDILSTRIDTQPELYEELFIFTEALEQISMDPTSRDAADNLIGTLTVTLLKVLDPRYYVFKEIVVCLASSLCLGIFSVSVTAALSPKNDLNTQLVQTFSPFNSNFDSVKALELIKKLGPTKTSIKCLINLMEYAVDKDLTESVYDCFNTFRDFWNSQCEMEALKEEQKDTWYAGVAADHALLVAYENFFSGSAEKPLDDTEQKIILDEDVDQIVALFLKRATLKGVKLNSFEELLASGLRSYMPHEINSRNTMMDRFNLVSTLMSQASALHLDSHLLPISAAVFNETLSKFYITHQKVNNKFDALDALDPSEVLDTFNSPAPGELTKMASMLPPLRARLLQYLSVYPHHSQGNSALNTLTRLSEINVLQTSVSVALTGLTLFLKAAELFNQSVGTICLLELGALKNLMMEWRRLECNSLNMSLKRVQRAIAVSTAPTIFSLLDDLESNDPVEVIHNYILKCPIGQIASRSKIVASLAVDRPELHHISGVILTVAPLIIAYLSTQRVKLSDNLSGLVRIHKWDQKNIYLVSQQSEKLHSQVNKIVKQWSELLTNMTVETVLKPHVDDKYDLEKVPFIKTPDEHPFDQFAAIISDYMHLIREKREANSSEKARLFQSCLEELENAGITKSPIHSVFQLLNTECHIDSQLQSMAWNCAQSVNMMLTEPMIHSNSATHLTRAVKLVAGFFAKFIEAGQVLDRISKWLDNSTLHAIEYKIDQDTVRTITTLQKLIEAQKLALKHTSIATPASLMTLDNSIEALISLFSNHISESEIERIKFLIDNLQLQSVADDLTNSEYQAIFIAFVQSINNISFNVSFTEQVNQLSSEVFNSVTFGYESPFEAFSELVNSLGSFHCQPLDAEALVQSHKIVSMQYNTLLAASKSFGSFINSLARIMIILINKGLDTEEKKEQEDNGESQMKDQQQTEGQGGLSDEVKGEEKMDDKKDLDEDDLLGNKFDWEDEQEKEEPSQAPEEDSGVEMDQDFDAAEDNKEEQEQGEDDENSQDQESGDELDNKMDDYDQNMDDVAEDQQLSEQDDEREVENDDQQDNVNEADIVAGDDEEDEKEASEKDPQNEPEEANEDQSLQDEETVNEETVPSDEQLSEAPNLDHEEFEGDEEDNNESIGSEASNDVEDDQENDIEDDADHDEHSGADLDDEMGEGGIDSEQDPEEKSEIDHGGENAQDNTAGSMQDVVKSGTEQAEDKESGQAEQQESNKKDKSSQSERIKELQELLQAEDRDEDDHELGDAGELTEDEDAMEGKMEGQTADNNIEEEDLPEPVEEQDLDFANIEAQHDIEYNHGEEGYSYQAMIDLDDHEIQNMRNEIELILPTQDSNSEDLWTKLQKLTQNQANDLAYSLNLAFQATVKNALIGDFKTGKKLNLRRIIPYIASDFRKDQIWLRRTKPNKRDQSVLIAVDDSFSMVDGGAAGLSLEAVATVLQALSSLNLPHIGLLRFGESCVVERSLAENASLASQLPFMFNSVFSSKTTDFAKMMQVAMAELDKARSMNSSHQLLIILTDGRIQKDKEKLSAMIASMIAKQQLPLIVMLDPNNKLPQMVEVNFENGKVKKSPYLESMPFPYYLIVQNLNKLTELLGETIRSWIQSFGSQ